MTHKIVFFVLCLGLSGCATSYQLEGFSGGYSETRLDQNVFRVSFRGNGYTGRERAADFCLLRSAELALASGFSHFIIVDAGESTSYSSYTTPQTSTTTANVSTYGNHAYGTSRTQTYGGQTYVISKPRATNTVVMFKGKPDLETIVYDATFVYKSIRSKYGIQNAK